MFRIPTNKTPTLAISCIIVAKPPLIEGSDISLMNIGATKAYAHPLIPEKYISPLQNKYKGEWRNRKIRNAASDYHLEAPKRPWEPKKIPVDILLYPLKYFRACL